MIWQDLVISFGQIAFMIALIYNIFSPQKPPKFSCILTAIVLWVFVPAFWTSGLVISASITGLSAIGWSILYFQKRK